MKVFLDPNPGKRPDRADGGIRRVLDAQIKYLPQFGVEIVRHIEHADLTAGHVDHLPIVQGKPFVSHNHGLMWREYFNNDNDREINASVVNALIQTDAITTPSKWVAQAIGYGLLRTPRVIYHGVDVDEWTPPNKAGDYVLWNKARADAVSNPKDMNEVAQRLRAVKFISTLGNKTSNVSLCGVVNYGRMKALVNGAGVYLATARETFGIGTLEALASGVPVAGWDYGGQSEIIQQGETGYLAPYGDYETLADCVTRCIAERVRLSTNARADTLARWQWVDKIEQYANLYKHVLRDYTEPRPKVSVIVPCHNLARFLSDALESVLHQTEPDFECLIIDDASTDNTLQVAERFTQVDKRFRYHATPENLKLSRALNFGHSLARGKYAINLDADNVLPPETLAILADALDTRRDVHIVYGALEVMDEHGENRRANEFPYPHYDNFSWYGQMAHLNQLHSSAMMRREVFEQSAGYRERQWRAEDAEFWCRVSSFGFRIERVTDKPTLVYRWRGDSKSMLESRENQDRDGDWCEYFPWRTARNAAEGLTQIATNAKAYSNAPLVPFGAQGNRTDKNFWDVWHRQDPLISVIIPVGNGHLQYLNDALDSLVGQTMHEWEAVVVNDTDDNWTSVPGAPYARVIRNTHEHGAGTARNIGIDAARGTLVFFLDADDMLKPDALLQMTRRLARGDARYVYCDALVPESPNRNKIHATPEYTQGLWLRRGLHSQAVLMLTEDARKIRFDETMRAWEDWDFFIRLDINGICGARVPDALLLYRKHLGNRSNYGHEQRDALFAQLKERYRDYVEGSKKAMGCQSCSGKAVEVMRASRALTARVDTLDKPVAAGFVRMKYTGAKQSPVTYYSNGHAYPAAATPKWQYCDVPEADADGLIRTNMFVKVRVAPIVPPAPETKPADKPVETARAQTVTPTHVIPTQSADAMAQAVKQFETQTGKAIQPVTQTASRAMVAETVIEATPTKEKYESPKRRGRQRKAAA